MSETFEQYRRLADQAFDAWDRLIGDPDSPDAKAEVAALETALDALEPDLVAIARSHPAFQVGEWPEWMLELAGESTPEAHGA
ncbi:MAG: hypothetical protein WCJ64_22785 [Rhodospirillaceae bacterium]